MSNIPPVAGIIIELVTSGHSVHVKPHRLQNDWLGLDIIGFCVDVKNSSGEIVANGVHASLKEAMSDAWLMILPPDEDEGSPDEL